MIHHNGRLSSLLLIAALISAFFTACSEKDELLLDHVPDDIFGVAIVNIDSLSLKAGCQVAPDGSLILTPDLKKLCGKADKSFSKAVDIVCAVAPYINTVDLAIVCEEPKSKPFLMFEIFDYDKLTAAIEKMGGKQSQDDDFDVFDLTDCQLVASGRLGWIVGNVQQVKDLEQRAAKGAIADLSPLKDYLDQNHDFCAAFNPKLEDPKEDYSPMFLADIKNGGLFAELSFMDGKGDTFNFQKNIGDMDRSVLEYIPQGTQILLGIGEMKDSESLLEALRPVAKEFFSEKVMSAFGVATGLSSMINGSTIIALAPDATSKDLADISPDTWEMLFLSKMSEQNMQKTVDMAKIFLDENGYDVTDLDSTEYTFKYDGRPVNFGIDNGYIYAANYDLDEHERSPVAPENETKLAMFRVLIPKNSETAKAFGLPWGVSFHSTISRHYIMFVLRLPGANGPVLKEVIARACQHIKD